MHPPSQQQTATFRWRIRAATPRGRRRPTLEPPLSTPGLADLTRRGPAWLPEATVTRTAAYYDSDGATPLSPDSRWSPVGTGIGRLGPCHGNFHNTQPESASAVMREGQGSKTSAHCNLKIPDSDTLLGNCRNIHPDLRRHLPGPRDRTRRLSPSAGYSFNASKHTRHTRTGLGMLNFAIGSLFIEQEAHTSRPQCRQ